MLGYVEGVNSSVRPARPPAPFTAIICVSRPVNVDHEHVGWKHSHFEEIGTFDARDAWAQAEDFDANDGDAHGELRSHVQGVSGPGGWVARPAWVDPRCCETPEQEQARWEVHVRAEADGATFAA